MSIYLVNKALNSLGVGAVNFIFLPVIGCVKSSSYACKPNLLIGLAGSPYLSSPIM